MKRYFIHSALFRIVAPAVYGVLIYLLILLINNEVTRINDLFVNQEVYVCIILCSISFELMRFMIVLFDKSLKSKPQSIRLPLQLVATCAMSVFFVLLCLSLYFKLFVGFSISGTQLFIFGVSYGVTALLYNLLYYSNYYLQKENTLKLAAEKQQRDVLEMEINEFKNDINPDLLYESLENLIGLMYRDVDEAEAYIDALAGAYRYVLSNRQEELISLQEELGAARTLIKLLNERHFGQLKFDAALDVGDLECKLIPGSLPIILEHVIRNTIITRLEPFIIRCYVEEGYLTIQAALNDRLVSHSASELALMRLQKSYSLYSDLPLIRVKAYQENYIKLPVIRVQEEVPL